MKEKAMFATDSFMNAEVTYREGRVRRDWSARREVVAARRAAGSAKRGATKDAAKNARA
jgi:hypothetical protein